jgi:predicted transcriptional regulator
MPDATPDATAGTHAGAGAGRRPSGELEASVLATLWAAGGRALTPAQVQRELGAALGADLARTTVTTILARLHDKGSVSRARAGRGYAYLPVQDSPGLAARRMRTELDRSGADDRGAVLARFVSELAPADEALLRALLAEAGPGASGAAPAEPAPRASGGTGVPGAGASGGTGAGDAAASRDTGGPGAGDAAASRDTEAPGTDGGRA